MTKKMENLLNSKKDSSKKPKETIEEKKDKMLKNQNLNLIKCKALAYHSDGMKFTEIAKELGKGYMTIKRWIEKFNNTGNLFSRRKGSGRKTKISVKVKASIKRRIKEDPSLTYLELAQKVSGIKKVSRSSVARYLSSQGTKYTPRNEQILNTLHREKRVKYSKKYFNKSLKKIIYSDECHIDLNRNKKKYFHFKGEPKIGRTVFNPNVKVHIWGAISYYGKISITFVNGMLTGESYQKLLKDNLFDQADRVHGKGNWSFQQDNHPAHKTKKVMEFFEKNNVNLIQHPARSPDLNPIESVWFSLKNKVSAIGPKNLQELKEAVMTSWEALDDDLIKRTVLHLHKVFEKVIDRKGGYADDV